MQQTYTWKDKMIMFSMIMWPILVTQISLHGMTVVDTMMSGRAGTDDLAGVAIGSSLWLPVFLLATGILLAVTPIVAQLLGGGQTDRIAFVIMQAVYLSIALSLLIIGIGAFVLDPVLTAMKLDPSVQYVAKHYLIGLSFGIVPLFVSGVIRNFFDAQGFTKITMVIILIAVPCNIALNYIMIFGHFGFPRLGGIGAGYATAVTYWIILLISIFMVFRIESTRVHRLFLNWFAPSWREWKEQLSIGIPIGLTIFLEASIFSAVTLLMSIQFDTLTIASNQAAMTFAGLMFMLPLSMSMALTILVGYEVGARRLADANQYSKIGIVGAVGVIALATVWLYFNREWVAYLYTESPDVVAMIMQFLVFVIFFQLSDAVQAALQGVLRGYKDVSVPFVTALISYWVIGIPTGYLVATYTSFGPFGYWVGITFGLSCAAIGFGVRLFIVQRRRSF